MFSHIMVGSNDIQRSKKFYNAILSVIGAGSPTERVNDAGKARLFYAHKGSSFSIAEPLNGEPVGPSNGSTIGFVCDSPEQIQEFHDAAIAHGATSVEDPPGLRENSYGSSYLCYFLDPDGHKICGVHRPTTS